MIFGKHINKYYVKYALVLLLGLIALVAVDYIQLEVPKLYRLVVNGVKDGEVFYRGKTVAFDIDFLLDKVCLPFLLIILVMVVGRFLWRVCFFGSAIRVETDIRKNMFDHCKELSQQYYQVNKVGNMMSLFTNDLETVQECFGSGLMMFLDALFLGALSVYNMFKMNGLLTLLSLIPMAFMLFIGTLVGKAMMKKWEERQAAFSSLSDFSQESFSGISVIKAFVKEFKELMAFKKLNVENEEKNITYTKISVLLRISVSLFVESVVCIILGYGGYLVHKGVFNAGELVEFIGYFNAIVWPVMAISELIEMRSRGKASLDRISELLEAKIDVKDAEGAETISSLSGEIEFKNLTFRYPGADYDALKNVSFKIEAGERVGIIGKTGSGKTTLVDLLLRTYNVPDGMVFVDGKDVNSVTIQSVRQNAAYVPQDNFLFSDTIERNVAFSLDETEETDELVKRAARLAVVHDNIVGFKDGYQTVLGERGVTVSGGQKQRISIARALLKNAPILILDDSVSAVDTDTEKVILNNLRQEREGKTTILIAHRVSTIEKMDKIVMLEDGEVIAVGKHEDLLSSCPAYKTAVELQKLEEEKERS